VSVEASGDTAGLQAIWDEGYDGTWVHDTTRDQPRAAGEDAGLYALKVRVRNAGGYVVEQVLRVEVGAARSGLQLPRGRSRAASSGLALLLCARDPDRAQETSSPRRRRSASLITTSARAR
jgi:hypothetical protein